MSFKPASFIAIPLLVALGACVQAPAQAPTTPAAPDTRVVAECTLYEEAMNRDAAITGVVNQQIVLGCPGYEHVRNTDNRFTAAGSFLRAASADIPQAALDMGSQGKNFYQKMILRGVPAAVANEMIGTQAFRNVVAAYS